MIETGLKTSLNRRQNFRLHYEGIFPRKRSFRHFDIARVIQALECCRRALKQKGISEKLRKRFLANPVLGRKFISGAVMNY